MSEVEIVAGKESKFSPLWLKEISCAVIFIFILIIPIILVIVHFIAHSQAKMTDNIQFAHYADSEISLYRPSEFARPSKLGT